MYILKFETWKVVLLFKYSNCKMTYFIKIDKIQEYENKRVEFRLNRIPNCLMSFNQKLDNDRDSLKRIQAKQSYLHNFQEFNWNPKLMSFLNLVILYFPRTDKKKYPIFIETVWLEQCCLTGFGDQKYTAGTMARLPTLGSRLLLTWMKALNWFK